MRTQYVIRLADGRYLARNAVNGIQSSGWRQWVWTRSVDGALSFASESAAESFARTALNHGQFQVVPRPESLGASSR